MKNEFVLRFEVGNEGTIGDANLADMLRKVAEDVAYKGITDNRRFPLRDYNGNTVGHYGRYTSEDADDEEITGTQQTNSEISHDGSCDVFRSWANACSCGAFLKTQGL